MQHDQVVQSSSPSPDKKIKRFSYLNNTRCNVPEYKECLRKDDKALSAKCLICYCTFAIGTIGLSSVKQHLQSLGHKQKSQAVSSSKVLFCKKNSADDDLVNAGKLTQVFHTVKHNLFYNIIIY